MGSNEPAGCPYDFVKSSLKTERTEDLRSGKTEPTEGTKFEAGVGCKRYLY